MGCGQEKGEARSGTTGEPFDEPTAQNAPALRVLFRRPPAVLRRSTDVTASLFAARLAVASPQQNAAESIRSQLALALEIESIMTTPSDINAGQKVPRWKTLPIASRTTPALLAMPVR